MMTALPAAPGPDYAAQVTALLEAGTPRRMATAARQLRTTTHAARRLAISPAAADQHFAADVADQAIDAITALDYLLFLLSPAAPRLRMPGDPPEDTTGRAARQLDARALAVRQCTRLLKLVAGRAGDTG